MDLDLLLTRHLLVVGLRVLTEQNVELLHLPEGDRRLDVVLLCLSEDDVHLRSLVETHVGHVLE